MPRRTHTALVNALALGLSSLGACGCGDETGQPAPDAGAAHTGPVRKVVLYNYVDSASRLDELAELGCRYIARAGLIDLGRGAPDRSFMPSPWGSWENAQEQTRVLADEAHQHGMLFEATLQSFVVYADEMSSPEQMARLDAQGVPLSWDVAPDGVYLSDLTKVAFQDALIAAGKIQIDAGVDAIVFDDPQAAIVGVEPGAAITEPSQWEPFVHVLTELRGYAEQVHARSILMSANQRLDAQPPDVDFVTVGYTHLDPKKQPTPSEWTAFQNWAQSHGQDKARLFFLDYEHELKMPIAPQYMTTPQSQVGYAQGAYEVFRPEGFVFALPIYYANDTHEPLYDARAQGAFGLYAEWFRTLD